MAYTRLGIAGGGQLGWMIALEAQRLGIRTFVQDRSGECPARRAAEGFVQASLDDTGALCRFARQVDVLTVETEHVDYRALEAAAEHTRVRPAPGVLQVVQDRLQERRFLARHGFPQTDFFEISSRGDCVGDGDYIAKSRFGGYDGKGQARTGAGGLAGAWAEIGEAPAVAESVVDFECEISVVLARGVDGGIAVYPVAENRHRDHILHTTIAPARVTESVAERAVEIAVGIARALDYVGVLATEMFVLKDGSLLVNEMAPRVHNSGHYTFGGCLTSQFEQHARAVCALPLGETRQLNPCIMLNLLGDLWANGEPDWPSLLARENAKLFLYGKTPPKPGRKMGHVLFMDKNREPGLRTAEACFRELAAAAGMRDERL
jgi:5-(carboxyamino)imidazole ribonucleotide synthase